jgi:hypothetical protein
MSKVNELLLVSGTEPIPVELISAAQFKNIGSFERVIAFDK